MFTLDKNPTFWTPVAVGIPGHSDGQDFRAKFRALTVKEFSEHDLAAPEGAETFLRAVLVATDEIVDGEGHPVPHSPDLVGTLIDLPHVRAALVRAYVRGIDEAARGN